MGLYWRVSHLFPFLLKMGVIEASFHVSGISAFFMDLFIISLRGFARTSAHLCKTIGGIESGPAAELILVDLIASMTSASDIWIDVVVLKILRLQKLKSKLIFTHRCQTGFPIFSDLSKMPFFLTFAAFFQNFF